MIAFNLIVPVALIVLGGLTAYASIAISDNPIHFVMAILSFGFGFIILALTWILIAIRQGVAK